jgi:hypothetical protein
VWQANAGIINPRKAPGLTHTRTTIPDWPGYRIIVPYAMTVNLSCLPVLAFGPDRPAAVGASTKEDKKTSEARRIINAVEYCIRNRTVAIEGRRTTVVTQEVRPWVMSAKLVGSNHV